MTIRILVADEHRMFRDVLRTLLEAERDFDVVGEADDGVEALSLTAALDPDILLLDVAMPKLSGLDVLRELAHQAQTTAAVLLTDMIAPSVLLNALKLGARGHVMKQWPAAVLLEGIRHVMAGQYWFGRESESDPIQTLQRLSLDVRQEPRRGFGLTRRELEVTAAIVAGCSNKDIAEKLSLSEKTVKHHLTHIFDKLGVSTRLELSVFARHHELELPGLEQGIQPGEPDHAHSFAMNTPSVEARRTQQGRQSPDRLFRVNTSGT